MRCNQTIICLQLEHETLTNNNGEEKNAQRKGGETGTRRLNSVSGKAKGDRKREEEEEAHELNILL